MSQQFPAWAPVLVSLIGKWLAPILPEEASQAGPVLSTLMLFRRLNRWLSIYLF